ncbi:alpha/beta fold hydrolase [Thermodesulfobacteriota bacterium]
MKTFDTHDGLKIRFDTYACGAKTCRGVVVLLGGRSEFIEKYRETVDQLLARKLDVVIFDWRGQGLSDRLLPNRYKGYVASYEDYLKDLTCFMDNHVSQTAHRPVIMLGHSMGGHIALRYLHDHPGRVEKAVLTSPLIDIAGPVILTKTMKMIVKIAARSGFKKYYATRANDFDPSKKCFTGNRLTRDPHRFQQTIQMIIDNPDVAIGGVTFGWLDATFNSIQHIMADGYPESITTPVKMISAGGDEIVSAAAQKKICRRLPNCDLVMISNALHELLIETDAILEKFWELFDEFVLKSPNKRQTNLSG